MPISILDVQKAIGLSNFDGRSAHLKMAPMIRKNARPPEMNGQPRIGAVLVLLYCYQNELHLVLTKRREDLNSHAGQISFPGGKRDDDEMLQTTALRETEEEVGVAPDSLTILGQLTPVYILPSDFEVYPFVASYEGEGRPFFNPSPNEVAQIIDVPVRQLLDPTTKATEMWNLRGNAVEISFFAVEEHKVWGATAMMLSELVDRLNQVTAL